MKIAIVDSGFDIQHQRLSGCHISAASMKREGDRLVSDDNCTDQIGHGTGIASIIYRSYPSAELISVKIFEKELSAPEHILCDAIQWCVDNGVKIINLSLGIATEQPSRKLVQVCDNARKKNVLIVAASHNNRQVESYPAHFSSVMGVTLGKVGNRFSFGYIPDSPVEFVGKGNTHRIAWKDGGYTIGSGSSYACAYMTGIIANIKDEYGLTDIDEIRYKLIELADERVQPMQTYGRYNRDGNFLNIVKKNDHKPALLKRIFDAEYKLKTTKDLAIFPISEKEMSAYVDFPHYSKYNIVKFLDYPRRINVNKKFDKINDSIYRKLDQSLKYDDFDTLVLGYIYDQIYEQNIDFGNELLLECLNRDKNIVAFDRAARLHIEEIKKFHEVNHRGNLYVPEVTMDTFHDVMGLKYLEKVKVPVLSVIGTSNKQGKFSAQMRLKNILQQEGYNVAHIATEPQGVLFGADFSFPYGHKGTVDIMRNEWGIFLRNLMKGAQEYLNPHIILTGTQGMTVPRSADETVGSECATIEYLSGAQPDAFVCAINPQDSIELITNVCDTMRIFHFAKPVFFIMTPWVRSYKRTQDGRLMGKHYFLDEKEMKEKLGYFEKELGLPVLNIMDYANDGLFLSLVQDSFSE